MNNKKRQRRNGSQIPSHIILSMKLTAYIFFISILGAMGNVNAQRITLDVKGMSLKRVLLEVTRQSGFNFIYEDKDMQSSKPVTVKIQDRNIMETLPILFAEQPFSYEVKGKVIILKENQRPVPTNRVPTLWGQEQQDPIRGRVIDEHGEPLAGATIRIKGTMTTFTTDREGNFEIPSAYRDATLEVEYVGYISAEMAASSAGQITLSTDQSAIDEVDVRINTGFQNIPKERATGSFVFIDSALLGRSVTTNILERLDGVASSTIFNRTGGYNTPDISIRGRSTILGNPNPLVVVDNFPYHGDIGTINPADVESITILKDAAAASIWGTQAGNGVIVITTKSGKYNQKTKINLLSNVTVGQKPRLFTQRQMTSAEYIEVETDMFERGRYNTRINNGFAALSPAVEILLMHRNGQIDLGRRDNLLDSLAQQDIRHDLLKYFYQTPVNQQYNLNISGGSQHQKFFLSAGYDRNLTQEVGSKSERMTLNGQNTYDLLNGRLQLISGLQFTNSKSTATPTFHTGIGNYPYLKLVDEQGNALPLAQDVRLSYAEAQEGNGLLDWSYRPLDEREPSRFVNTLNFRIQNNLTYKIINPLSISAFHSYQKGLADNETWHYADSYYTRNQINRISSVNPTTGVITQPIREGDILQTRRNTLTSHYGRLQLAFDQTFSQDHNINAIAGAEISEILVDGLSSTLYGYNPETGSNTNAAIDFSRQYPMYVGTGTFQVPTGLNNNGQIDRNLSYYANASYTCRARYTLSGSARKDQSNIFGVDANQRGVPLWSLGGLWHIANEEFYNLDWLPKLSLRTTYGYNGNVDKSASAYFTTQLIVVANTFGLPQYRAANPPNPSLRWERISNVNLALDFALRNDRLSGTVEVYRKHGQDLIGLSPIAPQTGISDFRGNNANLRTNGVDIILNSLNFTGTVQWATTLLANFVKDRVTHYEAEPGGNSTVVLTTAYEIPLVGYPFNGIFAYRWAGLDDTGSPQGYLDGEVSTNYAAIGTSTNRHELLYMGSMSPRLFGAIVNTVSYKNIQLSFLINYKARHVFRLGNSLNNTTLYGTISPGSYTNSADYGQRWQQPGDELITHVPALIYPANANRTSFYSGSEVLVHKADHIRLQDVRLGYDLDSRTIRRLALQRLSIFCYANNLGILWRANKDGFDPESFNIQQTSTIAFGLTANF